MDNVSGAHLCAQSCSSLTTPPPPYRPVSPRHISPSPAIALTVGYDLRTRRTCARSALHCSQMVWGSGIHGSHSRLEHGVCHPHDLAQDKTPGRVTLQKYLTACKNTRGSEEVNTRCEHRPSSQASNALQKRGWSAHLGTEGEVFCCPAPRQVPDDERGRIRTYSLPGAGEERHVRRLAGSEVHLLPAHERETRPANRVLWSGIVSGMTEAEEALGSE